MIIKLKDGRFVIPKVLREALGLSLNDEIELKLEDDKIIIINPKNK